MDFIFMLTQNDQTVPDCLDVVEAAIDSGVTHLGFKDVGVSESTLQLLTDRIKAAGRTCYLEVVSTTIPQVLASAHMAKKLKVDRLMGGVEARKVLEILEGSGLEYYPFPGSPTGHPTQLKGSAEKMAADCRDFEALGCNGVDLLAYRATEADPLLAIKQCRAAVSGRLIVAGSIDSPDRIKALKAEGVDAFTIGSAALDHRFLPGKTSLAGQLEAIMAACQ